MNNNDIDVSVIAARNARTSAEKPGHLKQGTRGEPLTRIDVAEASALGTIEALKALDLIHFGSHR